MASPEPPGTPGRTSLGELARLFARLGAISFGGPAAHIALMRDEVVRRRRWLSEQEFLDLLGATNLIPGPNSTEMAIHVGRARAGWQGLIVAGLCFIMPAATIVGGLAWAYVRFGTLPQAQALLYGVKPVVIAIVLHALWGLGCAAVKSVWLGALGLAGIAAVLLGTHELVVLAAGGTLAALSVALRRMGGCRGSVARLIAVSTAGPLGMLAAGNAGTAMAAGVGSAAAVAGNVALGTLFGVFLKAGAVLFGSGYVLLAFLRADLVERLGWMTEAQLLNAVAVGQVTPGPVFTTATFIGYVLGSTTGASVATLGIFLPAFLYVAASAPIVPRLRRSAVAGAALDGVNVASLALMAVVTWQLGRAALVDPFTIALFAIAAVLLLSTRVDSAWLILGGAIAGVAVRA